MSKVYNMWEHEVFGDAIGFLDYDKMQICGYFEGLKKNDEVRSKMESGKIARFKILEVHYPEGCAKGQFWGKVKPLGYTSEIILPDNKIINLN